MNSTKSNYSIVKVKYLLFVGFIVFNLNSLTAQTIAGSDGATNCANCAPPGYTIVSGTPDVSSTTIAAAAGAYGGGYAWNSTLPVPSNGHLNFITLRDEGAAREAVQTTINGLSIGGEYSLTFYAITATNGIYSRDYLSNFEYQLDNDTPQNITMTVQNQWQEVTVIFTATATSHNLTLRANNTAVNNFYYNSVNISITQDAVITLCTAGTEAPLFN